MNKKRRMKNRKTAQQLARDTAPPCANCGGKGPHWVGVPMTLGDLLAGTEPDGFWLCDKYYGEDGRRLPSNNAVEELAALKAERDKWEKMAMGYRQNSEHWLKKFNEVINAPSQDSTGSVG